MQLKSSCTRYCGVKILTIQDLTVMELTILRKPQDVVEICDKYEVEAQENLCFVGHEIDILQVVDNFVSK